MSAKMLACSSGASSIDVSSATSTLESSGLPTPGRQATKVVALPKALNMGMIESVFCRCCT